MTSASAVKDDVDGLILEEKGRFNEDMKNANTEDLGETNPSLKIRSKFRKLKKIKSEKRDFKRTLGSEARTLGL